MLTSSGQAANFFALFNVCECGSHIVASSAIYGGTFNLIEVTMKKMGITATFSSTGLHRRRTECSIPDNTRVVFGETIANPALNSSGYRKICKSSTCTWSAADRG